MLDPTGHAPGAVPPPVLSALRGDAAIRDHARAADLTVERARAERLLDRLDAKAAVLAEARAQGAADTAEAAFRLQAAALEVGQAALAAYVAFRDRVEAEPAAPDAPDAHSVGAFIPSLPATPAPEQTLAEAIDAMAVDSPLVGVLTPGVRL